MLASFAARTGFVHCGERDGEPDDGSFAAAPAFESNAAAHALDHLLGDREAETDAFFLRRGTGGACEFFEDGGAFGSGNAEAGIFDFEAISVFVGVREGADGDGALVGKFHGVGEHVEQNLAEAEFVCEDEWEIGIERLVDDLNFFRLRLNGDQGKCGIEQLAQRGGANLQRELVGIDAREIEKVVDEAKEQLGAIEDVAQHLLLFFAGFAEAIEDEACEAQDGIERRAKLVGDVGEEFVFGSAGLRESKRSLLELLIQKLEAFEGLARIGVANQREIEVEGLIERTGARSELSGTDELRLQDLREGGTGMRDYRDDVLHFEAGAGGE